MKKLRLAMLAASLAGVMTTTTQADPFERPPEQYAPVWYTPFPYQRNINMDWGVTGINPVTSPNPAGIPGANYEGYLDPSLWPSDAVALTGAVQFFTAANSPYGVAGIGINNIGGAGPASGTAVFTIDNVADDLGGYSQ